MVPYSITEKKRIVGLKRKWLVRFLVIVLHALDDAGLEQALKLTLSFGAVR